MEKNENKAADTMNEEVTYVHTGRQPRKMPVYLAVCLVVIFTLVSVLTTFAACEIYGAPYLPENDTDAADSGAVTPEIDSELPDYIQDLIKLDAAFRQNSFDGIDEEQMKEAILDAYIASTGDIYAEYMNSKEYSDYLTEQTGEFVGIGVSIVNSEIEVGGRKYRTMEIISVFKDSPALESGVMVGDCIMYVDNGGEMALVDTLGYTKALDVMLGEAGSLAKFVVYRPGKDGYTEVEFSISRRKVTTESVYFRVSEADSRVGIVNITGFDLTTPTQFKNAVNTLRDEYNCEYFVFDVRNNPGGALNSIQAVLSYFLNNGDLIVSTEYADGSTEEMYAEPLNYVSQYAGYNVGKEEIGMYRDLKCIVITNENTASAAELFTATLRDYQIAEVVGMRTYGKGCMQNLFPLTGYGLEGGLKLTVAMYYSASKTVYHGVGIEPDHVIDLSEEAKKINFFLLPEEDDAQLEFAIERLTK